MGQQQLLLVILVTIIVGIATVVAINIFGTASTQANRDAVRQDLLAAAAQAQAVYARPEMMGGLGNTFEGFDDIRELNIPGRTSDGGASLTIVNENGTYVASAPSTTGITLTGTPTSDEVDIVLVIDRQDDGTWDFSWDGVTATEAGETE